MNAQIVMIVPLGEGPVDPGFGGGRPAGGGRPDNSLPGSGGRPDNSLPWAPGGGRPDNSLPGGGGHPWAPGHRPDRPDQGLPGSGGYPSHGLPGQGGRPDAGLPEGPPAHPWLPGFIHGRPDNTLPLPPVEGAPPHPDHLPAKPGEIYPPLPPSVPPGLHAILVWISGLGYRYAVIEVPANPSTPDAGLPPTAAPKPA